MLNLKSKTILITGASSGIGYACAQVFGKKGANLILISRRIEKLNTLAENLKKKYSTKVRVFKLDIRNRKQVEKIITSLPPQWNNIDVLINNAGLSRGLDNLYDGKTKDWEEMIDTNIKGLLYVSRFVLPLMLKQNKGHIINIGSIAGHEVYPKGNVYCATKHAVDAITKGMRIDLNGTNVRVTTIDPGLTETEFSLVRFRGDKKRAMEVYKNIKPLRTKDIADAVLFAATRDKNVVISEMILLPLCQATPTIVYRNYEE